MPCIRPFRALRPRPDLAARICELPYDVMSRKEARKIAVGNPLSFLHISRAEIDLSEEIDPYDSLVYDKAAADFQQLIEQGFLLQDSCDGYYIYRQIMAGHLQVGIVGVASCDDYERGTIKRHELTRPDKETDRIRHIAALGAQTGPAFLIHPGHPELEAMVSAAIAETPEVDYVSPDGVRHSSWSLQAPECLQRIETAFAQLRALYIADGHHRSAAACRVSQARQGSGHSGYFLSVIFPQHQVKILPYNRVLKDLNGLSPEQLLSRLETSFEIRLSPSAPATQVHELGLFIAGRWRTLKFKSSCLQTEDPVGQLDVSLLQQHVLAPIFGIEDPRTSERIGFVGGIRGTAELERLVHGGEHACAFSLSPTRVEDLLAVADAGKIMPPKSTWFEPKLRDGMFSHLLD